MKRTETETGDREVETFTASERSRIENAMNYRFSAYLKPGEKITVDGEKGDEYVYTELAVEAADDSFRLDLETAMLAADQGLAEFPEPDAFMERTFEFLKLRLYEFFKSNRTERFHVDWRHYTVEGTAIRFRGRIRKPKLEEKADELLDDQWDEGSRDEAEPGVGLDDPDGQPTLTPGLQELDGAGDDSNGGESA